MGLKPRPKGFTKVLASRRKLRKKGKREKAVPHGFENCYIVNATPTVLFW
jgi:hypothetical protein